MAEVTTTTARTKRNDPRRVPTLAPGRRTDWRDHANCRDADPEIFFPVVAYGRALELAWSYCNHCPVAAQCLGDALASGATEGIWGGVHPGDLDQLRRQRKAAATGGGR